MDVLRKNIDRYGHCVCCHRNLIIERVSDGKVIQMFHPDRSETDFLLDDGSKMRVCVCHPCKLERDFSNEETQKEIMECVINGWQLEVDGLVVDPNKPEWDNERAKKYMEVYSNKKIIIHSELAEKHVIERRKEEILKKKDKELRGINN